MSKQHIGICAALVFVSLMLWCVVPAQAAERELHWDALAVQAHLRSDGVLDVTERHSMVFTGDWNGGERVFNVRPRQKLEFLGLERIDAETGAVYPLRETSVPNSVDDFTWTDQRTLRWRSRLPSDPPFANTSLIYVLHYRLSGILLKDDAQYRLNHDFAFPDRSGAIDRFTLNLELDPDWQPPGNFQNQYSAGPIEAGDSFVLNIPLRYSGSLAPAAADTRRPPQVVGGVLSILGVFAFLVLAFLVRERSLGRFVPVTPSGIDSAWIENNILTYPAEVVGAAWDGRVGPAEVVALIARMTAEGKLESNVEGTNSMRLRLKVDRHQLTGHERTLVDRLFFNDRTETSTKEVRQHYKSSGFDPAAAIKPELDDQVRKVAPGGDVRVRQRVSIVLYVAGILLLGWSSLSEPAFSNAAVAIAMISLFLLAMLQVPGWLFRSRIDWALTAATLLLIPASIISVGTSVFLWWYAAAGAVELSWTMIAAFALLAIAVANSAISSMKSRQSREAIAFRKRLAIGRSFFLRELEKPEPNLRDEWYPWLLGFGLGKQVDVWSSHYTSASTRGSTSQHSTSSGSSSSTGAGTSTGWTGGGGLSGGAGASGAWAAAAAGMAAGVAAPGSSSSGGSSSSSSSSSSGGGGGGGW